MNENSSDENNSSRKIKKRKRNIDISKKNREKEIENNSNKKLEEKNNILKTEKQLEIQKKLKYIFNEVREKGKYEYNKQEIPEHLKYHSDSDSSELSKDIQSKKNIKNKNKNNNNYDNDKDKLKNNFSKRKHLEYSSTSLKKKNKNKEDNNNKESEIIEDDNNEKNTIKRNNKNKEIVTKDKQFNHVRDIIEKLKAKKNEKEDLLRLEKEAEEQSIIREKINNKNDNNNEEKINESEIEREAEKIRKKEKKMEERRIAREKRRKMEEEEKRKKEKEFEDRKKKEENIKEKKLIEKKDRNEEELYLKENKTYINNKKINKYNNNEEKITKENINEINDENKIKNNNKNINDNKINKLETKFAYKKPNQKCLKNNKIYRPKKGIGAIKGQSQEKIDLNLINSKKLNENKYCKSPNITYTKKRSIGVLRENNFYQLNKSLGEFRPTEKGNNFINGVYNINSLDISSLPDLNSSFDSRLFNLNNNNLHPNLKSNDYYRTANKKYNNSTTNSGNITNSSNRFVNMNNLLNINGLTNLNGENDFINISTINCNNNSNSFYDLLQSQMSPYELNSSYNIGYSNPLINYTYSNNQTNLSNALNKSYLGMNNINLNLNNNFNYNNMISYTNNSLINIEDLLVLEDKLKEISNTLNKNKIIYNECFEFWNYYFNCSLNGNIEKLFTNIIDSNNAQISINYILMSILICYDCSFDIDILNEVYSILQDLLNLNHKNIILIYEYILSKISTDNKENIWVMKLLNLVNTSKNNDYNNSFNFNEYDNNTIEYSMPLIEKINYNTSIIIQNIRVLLKNYKMPKVEILTNLFKKINEKTYEDINNFFRQFILRIDTLSGSILASVLLEQNLNINFIPKPEPYVHTMNHKKYTLVLELDETLVHFKPNEENDGEGVLKVRPGITEFLDEMDKYYELIIFTGAKEDYANLLIDAIEENKIYFEHRLYREHMIIIDNEFVKDLTRIGRPLDKIIIVDNLPQNFKLQKENGINIKSFWGEDIYDDALFNLSTILTKIAQEGGDIRKGLEKYREDIVIKVSSNISKHDS